MAGSGGFVGTFWLVLFQKMKTNEPQKISITEEARYACAFKSEGDIHVSSTSTSLPRVAQCVPGVFTFTYESLLSTHLPSASQTLTLCPPLLSWVSVVGSEPEGQEKELIDEEIKLMPFYHMSPVLWGAKSCSGTWPQFFIVITIITTTIIIIIIVFKQDLVYLRLGSNLLCI